MAAGFEIGIHNSTLAIAVGALLDTIDGVAIPAAVYGIIMFFTGAAFGWLVTGAGVPRPRLRRPYGRRPERPFIGIKRLDIYVHRRICSPAPTNLAPSVLVENT